MSKHADQTDVIAANERLTTELAAAVRARDDAQAGIAAVTAERDEARTRATGLEKQLAEAEQKAKSEHEAHAATRTSLDALTEAHAKLSAERDALQKESRDFNARLAAELAKHGIRAEAIAPAAARAEGGSNLVAQYQALSDPKEKAAFLARHGEDLRRLAIAA
jgi:chromosome segregation ATPase